MRTYLIFILLISPSILAEDSVGRAFIQSNPPGATVTLENSNSKRDFTVDKVTPTLVEVPFGEWTVLINIKGHKQGKFNLKIDSNWIIKPPKIELTKEDKDFDIMFDEPDWIVFLDNKEVNDVSGNPARTPCTIKVPFGSKKVSIKKDGYKDIEYVFTDKTVDAVSIIFDAKGIKKTTTIKKKKVEKDIKGIYNCKFTTKYGVFEITTINDKYVLIQKNAMLSIDSYVQNNILIFHWPGDRNEGNVYTVEFLDKTNIKITGWTKFAANGFKNIMPSGKFWFVENTRIMNQYQAE